MYFCSSGKANHQNAEISTYGSHRDTRTRVRRRAAPRPAVAVGSGCAPTWMGGRGDRGQKAPERQLDAPKTSLGFSTRRVLEGRASRRPARSVPSGICDDTPWSAAQESVCVFWAEKLACAPFGIRLLSAQKLRAGQTDGRWAVHAPPTRRNTQGSPGNVSAAGTAPSVYLPLVLEHDSTRTRYLPLHTCKQNSFRFQKGATFIALKVCTCPGAGAPRCTPKGGRFNPRQGTSQAAGLIPVWGA